MKGARHYNTDDAIELLAAHIKYNLQQGVGSRDLVSEFGQKVHAERFDWFKSWLNGNLSEENKKDFVQFFGGAKDDLGGYLVYGPKPGIKNLSAAALDSYKKLKNDEFFD